MLAAGLAPVKIYDIRAAIQGLPSLLGHAMERANLQRRDRDTDSYLRSDFIDSQEMRRMSCGLRFGCCPVPNN